MRRVISGIIHMRMLKSGSRWRYCPEVYPHGINPTNLPQPA
jgi:hypothetical protein